MEQWTYATGLILGSLLILSVVYVFATKKGEVKMGEAFLVVMGAFLVGLTLWARVTISLGPEGLEAEFERLQEQIETVRMVNVSLNDQIETMAGAVETERRQVAELTRVLQEQQIGDPQELERIRSQILEVPVIDRDLLRTSRERLEPPP